METLRVEGPAFIGPSMQSSIFFHESTDWLLRAKVFFPTLGSTKLIFLNDSKNYFFVCLTRNDVILPALCIAQNSYLLLGCSLSALEVNPGREESGTAVGMALDR